MTYDEWKDTQQELIFAEKGWQRKWKNKTEFANKAKLKNLLSLEEYMYKAYEAGILHPSEIHNSGFHLSRINDKGDYTVDNCRFLKYNENLAERKDVNKNKDYTFAKGNTFSIGHTRKQGQKHHNASMSNETVKNIFLDQRSNKEIAKDFNIRVSNVCSIKRKDRWKSVTKDL